MIVRRRLFKAFYAVIKMSKATFYSSLAAYWVLALPIGLVMDYGFHKEADGYWMGLISGIFFSALFLTLRLRYIEKEISCVKSGLGYEKEACSLLRSLGITDH